MKINRAARLRLASSFGALTGLVVLFATLSGCGSGSSSEGGAGGGGGSTPAPTFTVTFTVNGSGSVTSVPGGITCPTGTCVVSGVPAGSYQLNATPSAGSVITNWSGDCPAGNSASCTLNVIANRTASITFTPTFNVSVNVAGATSTSGVASSSTPGGTAGNIACGAGNSGTCATSFVVTGSSVVLTASPAPTQLFSGWSGGTVGAAACAGTGTCTIPAQAGGSTSTVTATFAAAPVGMLNVSVAGGGTVTSTSAGGTNVNCTNAGGGTGVCVGVYTTGDAPVLTATASGGYSFVGWFSNTVSGSNPISCPGVGTCSFTKVAATQYLTAVFTPVAAGPNPLVVYQDIQSGPTTGGEGANGIYLSVFGKNFGGAGLGTGTVKVYLDNVEVANYRTTSVGVSKGRQDIQQITMQVGAVGGAANGKVLPIKVVSNGRVSNANLTFRVNPGNIYFVANGAPTDGSAAGVDGTGVAGDITKPFRNVQLASINNNGVAGCPTASGDQTLALAGVWGLVQPGDFIVMRGGTWTDISKDSFFLRAQNKTGSPATGTAGTGPITVMGYPGADVFINRNTTGAGGGIASADSGRQPLGCGAYMTFTNLRIESAANEGAFNTERGDLNPNGSSWRVINNEMTGTGCGAVTTCKGGGVAGVGPGGAWLGNHVHDVADAPGGGTDGENHGFYVEGPGPVEIAYNRIVNITGGNGIQTNDAVGGLNITNVTIHHNLVNGVGKHGINISGGSSTGIVVYNNVVMNTDMMGIQFNSTVLSGAKVLNNTVFNINRLDTSLPSRTAFFTNNSLAAGAVEIRNNIFVPGSAIRYCQGGDFSGVVATMSNNLCFGTALGALSGTNNRTGDPLFVSTTSGSEDLHTNAGGDGIDRGVDASAALGFTPDDFDIATGTVTQTLRPVNAVYDIGAYER